MVRFGWLMAGIGCAVPGDVVVRDGDALGRVVPVDLRTTGVTPGGETRLIVDGAGPGETVRFFVSPGSPGVGPCPAALGGLCLDLGGPAPYLGSAVADASGVAARAVRIPTSVAPGAVVTFQAAIARGGASVKSGTVVQQAAWVDPDIVVDGDLLEWSAGDEQFDTTAGIGAGWITWDADALYIAFDHPDLATGGSEHWTVVYFGAGLPGSTTGLTFGTQTPGLPFEANVAVRRKADGSFDSLEVFDAPTGTWISTPFWLGTDGSAAVEGDVLELRIPRDLLRSDTIEVLLTWVFEGAGFESTYAGVPADTFLDGYDPDPATYLVLDLGSPDAPTVQNP